MNNEPEQGVARKVSHSPYLEAAVAWEVCASIHFTYAKGRDALFTRRQQDFVEHAAECREIHSRAPNNECPKLPNCATCASCFKCVNLTQEMDCVRGNKYQPLQPMKLWREE